MQPNTKEETENPVFMIYCSLLVETVVDWCPFTFMVILENVCVCVCRYIEKFVLYFAHLSPYKVFSAIL